MHIDLKEMRRQDEAMLDQIVALGEHNHQLLRTATVFIYGLTPLGVQVAKNVVCLSPAQIFLCDDQLISQEQYQHARYLGQNKIGQSRSQVYASYFQQHAPYTKLTSSGLTYFYENPQKFTCIIVLDCFDTEELIKINKTCRSHSNKDHIIGFIYGGCLGLFSFTFADFQQMVATDSAINGITEATYFVKGCGKGRVQGESIGFDSVNDGDIVLMSQFKNSPGLNEKMSKVRKINRDTLQLIEIGKDLEIIGEGKLKKQDKKYKINHRSLFETFNTSLNTKQQAKIFEFQQSTVDNQFKQHKLHAILNAFLEFKLKFGKMPQTGQEKELQSLVETIVSRHKLEGQSIINNYSYLIQLILQYRRFHIQPLSQLWGAIIAHGVIKAIGVATPISQWMLHCNQSLLPILKSEKQLTIGSVQACFYTPFKQQFIEQARKLKIVIAGAGSRGFEVANACTALQIGHENKGGGIKCADMKQISEKNLSRSSFLRTSDIRENKARSLCQQFKVLNSQCNFEPLAFNLDRQIRMDINQQIWKQADLVLSAIDKQADQNYFNSQTIWHEKPMIHIGIKGACCSVTPIIPFETCPLSEYETQREELISMSDIKRMNRFPCNFQQILNKSASYFNQLFDQASLELHQYIENKVKKTSEWNEKIQKSYALSNLLRNVNQLSMLANTRDVMACIDAALTKFHQLFYHDINEILINFPPGLVQGLETLFWESQHRKIPHPIDFDITDCMHVQLVQSMTNIYAQIIGLAPIQNQQIMHRIQDLLAKKDYKKEIKRCNKNQNNDKQQQQTLKQQISHLMNENVKIIPTKLNRCQYSIKDLHFQFIYSMACVRAACYRIQRYSWVRVKAILCRVVPKIATAVAVSAALTAFEIIKFIYNRTSQASLNNCKMKHNAWSCNLQQLYQICVSCPRPKLYESKSFDPVMCGPVVSVPSNYTVWSKIDIQGPMTIGQLKQKLEQDYEIKISMIVCENRSLYTEWMNNANKDIVLKKDIKQTVVETKPEFIDAKEGIKLDVAGCRGEIDVIMPDIRFYF